MHWDHRANQWRMSDDEMKILTVLIEAITSMQPTAEHTAICMYAQEYLHRVLQDKGSFMAHDLAESSGLHLMLYQQQKLDVVFILLKP